MSDSVKKGVGLTPQGFDFLESDTDIAQVKTGDAASAKIPDVLSFPDIPVPPLAKDIENSVEIPVSSAPEDSIDASLDELSVQPDTMQDALSLDAGSDDEKQAELPDYTFTPIRSDDPLLDGLSPLPDAELSEATARYVGPGAVGPMKLMASRAMAPLTPRDSIRVIYQLIFDEDAKLSQAALRSFQALDDRVLTAVLGEYLPPPILLLLSRTLISKSLHLERVLLNRHTPDEAFVHIGGHCEDTKILSIVCGNQQRMLRNYDIIRMVASNLATMRSDLDRAVDFLVREGVFLEDVPHFADAFARLGKTDAMKALENIELGDELLTEDQRVYCEEHGLTAEQLLLGGMQDISSLLEAEDLELQTRRRQPLNTYPISVQIKMAMLGDHICVLEGLHSSNRLVSSAAIRNPKVREGDIIKIAKMKSIAEDVIRYISGNKDWTKSYQIKFSLVHHPKAPPNMVKRWMPLLRTNDLKSLAKSKQVPTNVSRNAKRLLMTKR